MRSSVLLYAAVGVCATAADFRYFAGEREIRRPNVTDPIKFKGLSVGTMELEATTSNGTKHTLSDGHHFGHIGWRLTDTDGGAWEFIPILNSTTLKKRSSNTFNLGLTSGSYSWNGYQEVYEDNIRFSGLELTDGTISTFDFVDWDDLSSVSDFAIDLFDGDSFIASSTSLIGDLGNIFANALEFFF